MFLSPKEMLVTFPRCNQYPTYRYALYFAKLKDGCDGKNLSDWELLQFYGEYVSLAMAVHVGWTKLGKEFSPAWGIWDKYHKQWVSNPHNSN